MQTRGSYITYIKGPLQIKGPYTDKGPPWTRSSYRRFTISTDKGSLQTRAPTLYTGKGPHIGMQGTPKNKSPCGQGYKGPYRQGGLTDKELIQTKGFYSKGPL